jgi:hypothetical protein
MRLRSRTVPALLALSAILLLVTCIGCSRNLPVSPGATADPLGFAYALAASTSPGGAFFPLTIGNRWHATAESHIAVVPTGGGPPTQEYSYRSDISRELSGTETLNGRTYTLLTETLIQFDNEPSTYTSRILYRQDQSGLYEGEQPPLIQQPTPASLSGAAKGIQAGASRRPLPSQLRARLPLEKVAAYERAWNELQDRKALVRGMLTGHRSVSTGPQEDEITRLSYPMRPGAEWTIRSSPYFASAVEGVDHLRLPAGDFPAYRIRIDSEFFNENDSVHVWFGRSGQLQFRYHLTSIATDENGDEVGRLEFDYREAVDEAALVKP